MEIPSTEFVVWTVIIIILFGIFTNGFGLFNRSYAGRWVKVKPEVMNVAMEKIRLANGFMDSDGMTRLLDMEVVPEHDNLGKYHFVYKIKIPEHVFHKVEHEVILRELGIRINE